VDRLAPAIIAPAQSPSSAPASTLVVSAEDTSVRVCSAYAAAAAAAAARVRLRLPVLLAHAVPTRAMTSGPSNCLNPEKASFRADTVR
jgi:hypothetical protein